LGVRVVGVFPRQPLLPDTGETEGMPVSNTPDFLELEKRIQELEKQNNDHQQITRELLDSEERFRALHDASFGGVSIHDKGLILDCNQGLSDITGFTHEELVGMDGLKLIAPDSLDEVLRNIKTGYDQGYEVEGLRKDGSVYPLAIKGKNIPYKGKQVRVIEFRDITDRKQAEEALRKSELLHGKMVANIGDVIVIIDRKGIFKYQSPNITKWFGWDPEDVVGLHTLDLVHPDDREAVGGILENILLEPNAIANRECLFKCKDGSYKWIEFSGTNLLEDPDIQGILVNYRDITKRIRAKEENAKLELRLQQAQKMEAIGTLAGGIAHDFNNILSVIMGYADLAKDDAPGGSDFHKEIDQIVIAAERARDLVKQILDFGRQTQAVCIPIQLQPLVDEGLKLLRSSLPSTISMVKDIDQDSGIILADPTQVHQILMNLCTNAYHAMGETGGILSVALKTVSVDAGDLNLKPHLIPGQYLKLTVSDTGVGIADDVIEKIFDPYFTTKEIGKGTGMGLAIIHGIMKHYGGAITVDSQLGEGSTFHVFFPVVEDEALSGIETFKDVPRGTERILFIDDEEILCDLGREILERLGYRVTVRHSSLEALETFQDTPEEFDLILTDQTMPDMTGADLAKRLLGIRPDIPIILCTGYSKLINEHSAKEIGIKEFATKPLTRGAIGGLIRKVLDAR
jgi:PAS domain S-box-containing protein